VEAAGLLGQVVFFLGFDGVMFTVGANLLVPVGVMACSLFQLCPSRPAQGVDEEEAGCSATELLTPDFPYRHSVHIGDGEQRGSLIVLSQRERLTGTDRPVPLGVFP
jgi:hypothetical protein